MPVSRKIFASTSYFFASFKAYVNDLYWWILPIDFSVAMAGPAVAVDTTAVRGQGATTAGDIPNSECPMISETEGCRTDCLILYQMILCLEFKFWWKYTPVLVLLNIHKAVLHIKHIRTQIQEFFWSFSDGNDRYSRSSRQYSGSRSPLSSRRRHAGDRVSHRNIAWKWFFKIWYLIVE